MANPLQQYLAGLDRDGRREYFREYERQRRSWPEQMQKIPLPADLPEGQKQIEGQWRSRYYLATLWNRDGRRTLHIHRVEMAKDGTWLPGVTWEDMQSIKIQCGLGLMVGQVIFPNDYEPAKENIYVMWLHDPVVQEIPSEPAND
jgi:hypothetical protein